MLLVAVFGSACGAAPTSVSAETTDRGATAGTGEPAPDELAFVEDQDAIADAGEDMEPEPIVPSSEFCASSANIWIHSTALDLVGDQADIEVTQIALANVAEWIERSTLFDEPAGPDHGDMFVAFTELQTTVATEFDFDWIALQSSTSYADGDAGQTYEEARFELVSFLNEDCEGQRTSDLQGDALARANELRVEFGAAPSTVVESDSLPGHAIFTHSSGRLIASFPSAWDHEERTESAIAELIASPDVDQFLAGEAVDGVHLQLVEATSINDFRSLLDATATGSSCERTTDTTDSTAVRQNVTQTFACVDHGASLIGQYNESRGLGLIIEASFDQVEASRADLIRLASIANSALWS